VTIFHKRFQFVRMTTEIFTLKKIDEIMKKTKTRMLVADRKKIENYVSILRRILALSPQSQEMSFHLLVLDADFRCSRIPFQTRKIEDVNHTKLKMRTFPQIRSACYFILY